MYGIISFKDEFTIAQLSTEIHVLRDALQKWNEVIVDISEVTAIDCAALQMLAAAKKECQQKGGELIVKKTGISSALTKSMGIDL